MDVILMAAGYGERLQPLTFKTPKCLLPVVHDEPLLRYWIETLNVVEEIDNIIISMCYMKDKIIDYIENNFPPDIRSKISYMTWDELPETGTAILAASSRMSNSSDKLIVINSDTFIPVSAIYGFIAAHTTVWNKWPIMLGVTYSPDVRDQSYVIFDTNNGIISQFKEKQSKIKEGYFWSGIAMLHKSIIDKSFYKFDLSKNIFGAIKYEGRMKAYPIECAWDIGKNLETYRSLYENLTQWPRDHIERLDINDQRFKPGSTMFGGVRGDHISRYLFASKYAVDKRIMDIGCGTGYGLKIMSYMAREITGIDNSLEAKEVFYELDCSQSQCPITFIIRDLNNPLWVLSNGGYGGYDLITAFEIIEHFKNPDKIINIAYGYMKTGGLFICSVPNETKPDMGMSIYHNHLFTLPQFRELLQKKFRPENITVYGQNQTYFSTIGVDNAGYFVAIARK